jgi:hypothetical protein
MPKGTLDAAVDSLIEDIRSKIVGKFEDEDVIIVDGRAEISCRTLNDLRQGRWIDNWLIMAAIQMADKPFFVRYRDCVPFDTPSRRGLRPDPRPLAGWRRTVEDEAQHGQDMLIHFCPINLNGNHFTLLEINEPEKKIYHYDSWASEDVISGRAKETRVGKTVEASIGSRQRH